LATLAGTLIPSLLRGKGLDLPGSKGKGLVLSGSKAYYFKKPMLGQGLILEPNSPFKNIPILGLIL